MSNSETKSAKKAPSCTVTFKSTSDGTIFFVAHVSVGEPEGEPFDTAKIYNKAVPQLRKAISSGKAPKDTFKLSDIVVMEYPDGRSKSYTDPEMEAVLSDYCERIKYKPNRDSRVDVTEAGGFTGGVMKRANVTLDKLSEEDFKRATEIIDRLQSYNPKLQYVNWVGDFGYTVHVGDPDTKDNDMKPIFLGGPFSRTPLVVEELYDILEKYKSRADSIGKKGSDKGWTR